MDCCDTAFCRFEAVTLSGRHERFSLCYSHYEDKHGGLGKPVRHAVILVTAKITEPMRRIRSIGQNIDGGM